MLSGKNEINNFDKLPIEIFLNIFSYLSSENVATVRRVSKDFKIIAEANPFWKKKYELHFPHLYSKLSTQAELNWYAEFRKAYENEYRDLPSDIRELFSLVKEGNIESLKDLIKFKYFDYKDKNGLTLLDWAVKKNNKELLSYFYQLALQEYQARSIPQGLFSHFLPTSNIEISDEQGRTILHWAILCYQPVDVINKLMQQGVNINAARYRNGETPLHIAAETGQLEVVNTLLAKNAYIRALRFEVNAAGYEVGITPLYLAAKNGHLEVVKAFLANPVSIHSACTDGKTPLHVAAEKGHLEVVNTLLAKNADINAAQDRDTITPLYLAAKNGHLDVVKVLLEQGANVNAVTTKDETPLHVAAEKGHLEVVNTLLAKNADINAAQYSDTITPLYLAAKNGHLDVVKVLLEQGANVNAIRMFSETPLYIAAKNGRLEVVKVLLEQRANINAANMFGKTPLAIAKNNNHPEIVQTINKQRLLDYINQTNARPDNHYKRTFTLFGRTIKYWGYSAKKKKEAANALKSVIFASADRSCLEVHKAALNNGELKSIYRDFGFR